MLATAQRDEVVARLRAADHTPVAAVVKKVIQEAQAAMTVAVIAATTASTAGGSLPRQPFLASDEARYITGVALPVDSGFMAKV